MSLTDLKVRNAKAREKNYKLADEKGLYLFITPTGSKYWRFKYRFAGKEKKLAFGVYPEVSLLEARSKRDEARKALSNHTDPGLIKKLLKQSSRITTQNSFEAIAREWFAKQSIKWSKSYGEKMLSGLQKNIFTWLGARPITEITAPELLSCLNRIETRGTIDAAHRTLQRCGRIFRYAIATGRAQYDISMSLRGALAAPKEQHLAALKEPRAIGGLLRAIDSYEGHFVTKCALRLAPLVFVRPGELRHAEWSEFDFKTTEWRIPASKMKMRKVHIVPLSHQAITILQELKPYTGHGKYLFPSVRTQQRPMSDNTVLAALRRLGFTKEEMTGHGFRSMASTLLNEQGWHTDAIERQLAHSEHNKIRAAYNYAEHLPERRKMMQHWSDYLDTLKNNK